MSEELIDKYAVQVEGGRTFTTVYNNFPDALKEAKRLAKKEMRVVYLVDISAVVTPSISLTVQAGGGEFVEKA